MQVDIQALDFDVGWDTQANNQIHHFQDDEGDDSAIDEYRTHTDDLWPELGEIAIREPAFTRRVDRAVTKTPVKMAPYAPPTPCTPHASRLSS